MKHPLSFFPSISFSLASKQAVPLGMMVFVVVVVVVV